jgi:glycosyltransferase involved in cell wall biosynthesis
MQDFRVSVVIPTFNRPGYLSQAVRSVLAQTYRAHEIIIIDNGSAPEYSSELSSIGSRHAAIRLLSLESNKGPGHARNRGISEAAGDWMLFLDDDDVLSPDFIEACFESVRLEPKADMVIARAICFRNDLPACYPGDAMGAINLDMYKKDPITTLLLNGIAIGSCLVSKRAVGPLRFREDIWHGEDTIFWFGLMRNIRALAVADRAFVGVRQHHDKITLMNNSLNPDGSPARPKETYIGIMTDTVEEQDCWNKFTLKVIFRRIADNSWYSLSMAVLLLGSPVYGLRIVGMLVRKRLYRRAVMITNKIFGRKPYDFTWLQRI